MENQKNAIELLRTKLNLETARMPWKELLRFFASGGVIMVSDDLDLVDVAVRIAEDDKQCIAQWMSEQRVGKVSDEQAAIWLETDSSLWAVVVSPWILVQQRCN